MEHTVKQLFRDQRTRWTLLAALITGAAAYGYGMLNNIINYDTAYNIPMVRGSLEISGRWTLSLLFKLTNALHLGHSLPFFNILVSLLLLSLAAVLLCRILRFNSRRSCILTGVVVLAFPAVASMTFFSYTMIFYSLAFLLITAACLLVEKKRKPFWYLVYSLLLALAIGVYQAFYPYAVMLAVLAVTAECLEPESTPLDVLKKGLLYIAAILLSYLWYRLGLKLMLAVTGNQLVEYQGINQMGHIELRALPDILKQMFRHYFLLSTHDYLSLSAEPISRFCLLLLFGISVGMLALGWRDRNPWKWAELAGLLLIVLPVASNLIILMVPYGTTYTLMGMGLLSLFLLPILLWEKLRFPRLKLRRVFGTALAAVLLLSSLEYAYLSNGCYRVLQWHNIQTENYFVTLMTRVKSMDGYDERYPVVYAGNLILDDSYHDLWADTIFHYGGLRQFDSSDPDNNGFNEFSRDRFISSYLGYTVRPISAEELERCADTLREMRTYPNDDSIRITDGMVLVKFD